MSQAASPTVGKTLPVRGPDAAAFLVSASPHVAAGTSTRRIMFEVLAAMLPMFAMALWLYGWIAVALVVVTCLGCLAAEATGNWLRGHSQASLSDGSAILTGAILAFSLPPSMALSGRLYMAFIGGAVAIGLAKAVFGGIGQNLFNPAMVGRAFLMICFPVAMGDWSVVSPAIVVPEGVDAVTMATPLLAAAQAQAEQIPGLGHLFLGNVKGCLGETSALAALLGGLWLVVRGIADWRLVVGTLGSVAVYAWLADLAGVSQDLGPLFHLTSGTLVFAAFFIVTDYVGAPLNPWGRLIFGIGVGVVTMTIRLFGAYQEGLMFAVLIMNALTPAIERLTTPTPLGGHVRT